LVKCLRVASVALLLALHVGAGIASAQSANLATPPANILLSNYNTVPAGPNAGLEGAYVARVGDPSSVWINPAGLTRGQTAELSGSSGLYQLATVAPSAFPNTGGSLQEIPSLVGVTIPKVLGPHWTLGLALLTPTFWQQNTDSQIVTDLSDGKERFAYTADAQFEQLALTGSAGYTTGRWRLGAGVALIETNISRNATVSDRLSSATGLTTVLIASAASGSAYHLRPLAGVQYDVSEHVMLGAMVRMPGFMIYKTGSYTADGVAAGGAGSQGLSFFDPSAQFEYHFPFEIHGGAGYVSPRFEIEADLHTYTRVAAYAILTSSQPIVTYADAGTGTAPAIETQPFNGFVSESRAVVNVSAGGHFAFRAGSPWRLHFGVETDRSPVGAADQVFTPVNLNGGTLGLSGTKGGFQFTVGLNYRTGTTGEIPLRPLPGTATNESTIRIHTLGLIYSLAYKF
jgi:hypothetical protein